MDVMSTSIIVAIVVVSFGGGGWAMRWFSKGRAAKRSSSSNEPTRGD